VKINKHLSRFGTYFPQYFVDFFPVRHGIRGHELERILKFKFGNESKFALTDCTLASLKHTQLKSMIENRMKSRVCAPTDANEFSIMAGDEKSFAGFYEVK